jgi:hypothetical protein
MTKIYTLIVACLITSCVNNEHLSSINEYYPNGAKMISADTLHGELNGDLKYYYENGKIKATQNWKNGMPDGEFLFYDENGKVIQYEIFENDSNKYQLLIGNKYKYPSYYDKQLIDFYSKYFKILPDTGYYLGEENYLVIKNIPFHLLRIGSNNGLVQPYGNYCVARLKTNERRMILDFYIILDGKGQKVYTLNREVKLRN